MNLYLKNKRNQTWLKTNTWKFLSTFKFAETFEARPLVV